MAARFLITVAALCGSLRAAPSAEVRQAFERMYNFDFAGAQRFVDARLSVASEDPLALSARVSALLFEEMNRLGILESEFFADDERIAEKKKLKPDPAVRTRIFDTLDRLRRAARARGDDSDALFSLALSYGIETDYLALVEKRQLASLSHARQSQFYAARLLSRDAAYHDAYVTNGISEYLLGSVPFFVKWFVRMDGVEGSKSRAVAQLNIAAKNGLLMGPFARILLVLIHLREKAPAEAVRHLTILVHEFPENPLFRKELAKMTDSMRRGKR